VGTGGEVGEKEVGEALRVMKGVYEATRLSKMVYSETAAGVSKFGDNTTSTEHIRLPREVVTGNTGLCIELALLHASVLKAAGDHAVIFLIPGHAFPGIKLGNAYYALEATCIGGAGIGGVQTADQALQTGMKEANDFFTAIQKGMPGYYLLDLDELNNEGYKEMELKDDPFLRQKVDQLAQNFQENNNPSQQQPQEQVVQDGGNEQVAPSVSNTNNNNNEIATHRGNINFQYPARWLKKNHPYPQLPILVTTITSPNLRNGGVEIYQIPGAENAGQAMSHIQELLRRLGVQVRYEAAGEQNGLSRYNGMSEANGNTTHWMGFLRVVNGGVEGVVVGSAPNSGLTSIHQQIINTIN
jgi:hypothetical protein